MIYRPSNNKTRTSDSQLLQDLVAAGLVTAAGYYNSRLINKSVFMDEIINSTSFFVSTVSVSQRLHAIDNKLQCIPLCDTCHNKTTKFVSFNQGYKHHCSAACAQQNSVVRDKRNETNIKRYGHTDPNHNKTVATKRANTCLDRYGGETPFHSTEVQSKVRRTVCDRYGVASTALVPEIATKQKQTRNDRYGSDYPFQSDSIQQKVTKTHLDNFGQVRFSKGAIPQKSLTLLNNKQWVQDQHVTLKKPLTVIATELGVSDVTVGNYLKHHGLDVHHHYQSAGELELCDYVSTLVVDTPLLNTRSIIHPYELDIYIPSLKIAIEYNGLYWHSEQQGKSKHYHHNKWKMCKDQGIQLITIFEDEWIHRKHQVELKLSSLMHCDDRPITFARKCDIVMVSTQTKNQFFEDYHIQGSGPGSINIGLQHNNEMVACMSFIKQKNKHYLNRYATSHRVPGGFSKLLACFKRTHTWDTIISFADNRWSDGNLYHKTGWTVDNPLPPDYTYVRHNERIHKFNYRRKYLPKLLKHFDPSLSEWENCKANGVLRVWDCGKQKFVLTNNNRI